MSACALCTRNATLIPRPRPGLREWEVRLNALRFTTYK